jgi:beta-1,4-mannooligosaccharide/beta-1,4-mannosyl-N-acetylglucosamine phosphorylase
MFRQERFLLASNHKPIGPLESSPIIHRYEGNPILEAENIPYPSRLVYNPGVAKRDGKYFMVFRNDYGFDEKLKKPPYFQLGLAQSVDGIKWNVYAEPILEGDGIEVLGSIDPRLTLLENRFFITYAQHTKHGYRATIASTEDFRSFTFIDRSLPDNRDGVLFPEKINGKYMRLDRPFPFFSRNQKVSFDIWISESPDLAYWGKSELLLCSEDIPFGNERLGPGSPPVKTKDGWLMLFHAVDVDPNRGKNGWEDKWQKRYTMGALLLDLENPRQIIGYSQTPLLVPEASYETRGFRNNIVYPSGLVLEDDCTAKIYYGAADTSVALAFAKTDDLIRHCLQWHKLEINSPMPA